MLAGGLDKGGLGESFAEVMTSCSDGPAESRTEAHLVSTQCLLCRLLWRAWWRVDLIMCEPSIAWVLEPELKLCVGSV